MVRGRPPTPALERWVKGFTVSDTLSYNDTPCWLWNRVEWSGYGEQFYICRNGPHIKPHRAGWILLVDHELKQDLDHLCRNRACVSIFHLEPVTPKENVHRSPIHGATKTHCKNGHEFSEENTYLDPNRYKRRCRICRRESKRKADRTPSFFK